MPPPFLFLQTGAGVLATTMITTLERSSRAAARGLSDMSIRNLFIIPTVLFLIVFNIFPLIYSLGYSFTDFRASTNAPASTSRWLAGSSRSRTCSMR